MAVFTAETV